MNISMGYVNQIFKSLALLIVLLCSQLSVNAAVINPIQQDFSQLIKQLDATRERHNIPAYALVITSPDDILVDEVRGYAKSGSVIPVSKHAYFRIGSITKTFVALSALAAESQGKLTLSDKASDYLDNDLYENTYKETHPITIEQLLEHTAGLPDMGREEFASNDMVTLQEGLQRFFSERKIQWQPGYFHSYSNTSYGLAGRVLEIASGKNINDWLTFSVFKPLDMSTATMLPTEKVMENLVPGYQRDGIENIPYWHMIYPSLGAINLQPRDMAKLLQLYLNGGSQHFTSAMLNRQEMPEASLAAQKGLDYGYGLGLYPWYRKGYLFFGHGGDADGYLSQFGYQKDAQLGFFLVINTFNNRAKREMSRLVESFLVNGLPAVKKAPEMMAKDNEYFTGDYRELTWRFGGPSSFRSLNIQWRKGAFYIKEYLEDWERLIYVGDGLFRRPFEANPTLKIFTDKERVYLVGDEGNFIKIK